MSLDTQEILSMLRGLDGIRQDPRYHPEGDALFHSLQAFEIARMHTHDRTLWLAALVHDVGKSLGGADHDVSGADLLDGIVCPRVVWMVRHHLDLLRDPHSARKRLRKTTALIDLEQLRRYDIQGRNPRATVRTPEDALAMITHCHPLLSALGPDGEPSPDGDTFEDMQFTQKGGNEYC